MFGRVRVSSSSPDELERPTAKLLKHDSLSIYGNPPCSVLHSMFCANMDLSFMLLFISLFGSSFSLELRVVGCTMCECKLPSGKCLSNRIMLADLVVPLLARVWFHVCSSISSASLKLVAPQKRLFPYLNRPSDILWTRSSPSARSLI